MTSITFWTRLEPYARLEDIETGLEARVHDPAWLLARQWQTGEFDAEDAGTPVQARVRMDRFQFARYGPRHDGPGEPYRTDVPLEALVEREPVQLPADPGRDLRLAAEAGLMFLRILARAGVTPETRGAFAREAAFALAAPEGADDAGSRYLSIMAGRAPDGFRLYEALTAAGDRLPPRPQVAAPDVPKVTAAAREFRDWFASRYSAPPSGAKTPPAWISERLEYAFAVAALTHAGALTFSASEYPGGTLDWYAFDVDPERSLGVTVDDPPPEEVVRTVMPAPLRYPGIAADRWWQLEDGRVNFSRIQGDPDELLRLLLVDFALLYSNDWFVLPIDARPGGVHRLRSLVVTDAFGERTLVPHYSATAAGAPEWRMFAASPGDDLLLLPPVLAGSLVGEPVEEVLLVRDELSNLVWAVERLAPDLAGGVIDRDAAHRRRGEPEPSPAAEPPADGALRYRLATTVPANWIPFQPVRIDPQQPAVHLRRAAALLDEANGPGFSRPLGRLLEPEREDMTLFEEEVPAAGARVVRQYQYARWVDGSTVLWLGRRKSAGRGEQSSGLRFDVVDD